ncbi:MAG TPA: LrgB family protein [Azospirillaceae bacterium]|nr:LrgB family protein [Azospirillaceae bacterium]
MAARTAKGGIVTARLADVWTQLASQPLLWLMATLAAYVTGRWVQDQTKGHPLANPVAIAIILLAAALILTGTPYDTYINGAQILNFLLGPATVALAVPLYQNLDKVRRMLPSLMVGLAIGSTVGVLSSSGTALLLGASKPMVLTLAPKAVTSPIAMGISQTLGGLPPLTAVLVILTGIFAGMFGWPILRLVGVHDPAAAGFAMGTAAHGIGTARAFQIDFTAGTFAGLGMGLNGLATAVIAPPLMTLIMG